MAVQCQFKSHSKISVQWVVHNEHRKLSSGLGYLRYGQVFAEGKSLTSFFTSSFVSYIHRRILQTRWLITAFTRSRHAALSWVRSNQSTSHQKNFTKISFNSILQVFSKWSFLFQISSPKPCMRLPAALWVPSAPTTAFIFTRWPEYLMKSINHEDPHD